MRYTNRKPVVRRKATDYEAKSSWGSALKAYKELKKSEKVKG
jgi:hypothetical protein